MRWFAIQLPGAMQLLLSADHAWCAPSAPTRTWVYAMLMTASLSRKPVQCEPLVCISTSRLSITRMRSPTRFCTCLCGAETTRGTPRQRQQQISTRGSAAASWTGEGVSRGPYLTQVEF